MNYLISGGTGFIGKNLCKMLMQEGHYVTIVTRNPGRYKEEEATNQQFTGWDEGLTDAVEKADVVINLAGESVFGKRWSERVKKSIYDSRILSVRQLVNAMKESDRKPSLFISVSAIGYYGDNGDDVIDETFAGGDDFLASVCKDWEAEAFKAEELGIRVAVPRVGIVLQDNGGMIEQMKLPFQLFVGGPVGHGTQYVSWIHMEDLCRALTFPVIQTGLEGAYNATSPNPVTMNELARCMGSVMRRPSVFRVPEWVVNVVLGEGAEPVMTSLRAEPAKLNYSGFEFEFEDIEEALADVL